jgi:predicted lysophospholipase L1 biosynthesis ABC-type transport system permease subunit
MWRFIHCVLGCLVGATVGLGPIGWSLGMFGHANFRDCSLVGGAIGALSGLVLGVWFVSAAFVGLLGSVLGGVVGYGVRYAYAQHLSPGFDMGYDYGAAYWVMDGLGTGAVIGILLGLWLVHHLRELRRVRIRRP